MGNGMNKVLPGLYLGNFRDARDQNQLKEHGITHILAIHDNARPALPDYEYLCIDAQDVSSEDLTQYFVRCNDFIHWARLKGGVVLVHCLAGVSRSVTITTAYVMTVTGLGWRDALNAVKGARRCANPNFGFQRQLLAFQHDGLEKERLRLSQAFAPSPFSDLQTCQELIETHHKWVQHGDESADLDDGLYPLPLNAYGKPTAVSSGSTSSNTASSSPQGTTAKTKGSDEMVDAIFESGSKRLSAEDENLRSQRESTARDILSSISATSCLPDQQTLHNMQMKCQNQGASSKADVIRD